jgi:regulator of RNase E activity RraA
VRDRFGAIYTAALADILDDNGFRAQTLPPSIRPLAPGTALAGPAFTVRGRPAPVASHDAALRRVLAMLGAVPAGHVAVYETNDRTSAQFGELSATSLASRGCAGAVIDGGTRDAELILREDFPVFARYVTPQDCVPRWEVLAHGEVSVVVGGVRVQPGDWVVGDRDGLVVVPAAQVDAVLADAEAKIATEDEIRDSVRAGMLPLEAYERYGTF